MILLEIEYYKGDIILRGKTVPTKELLEQMKLWINTENIVWF